MLRYIEFQFITSFNFDIDIVILYFTFFQSSNLKEFKISQIVSKSTSFIFYEASFVERAISCSITLDYSFLSTFLCIRVFFILASISSNILFKKLRKSFYKQELYYKCKLYWSLRNKYILVILYRISLRTSISKAQNNLSKRT